MAHIPAYYQWCRGGRSSNPNLERKKKTSPTHSVCTCNPLIHWKMLCYCCRTAIGLLDAGIWKTQSEENIFSLLDMLVHCIMSLEEMRGWEIADLSKPQTSRALCIKRWFCCLNQTPPHAVCLAAAALFFFSSSSPYPDSKQSRLRPWEVPQVTYLSSMDKHKPPTYPKWLRF